jgi:hypothetical protein
VGLLRTVTFPTDSRPSWESVSAAIRDFGETPVIRMIDDLPAFPDEIPEAGWRELRISLAGGMVTLRAEPAGWSCVIWGNADAALVRSRDLFCRAIASAGGGQISQDRPLTPDT